jgi:hypothetical protein
MARDPYAEDWAAISNPLAREDQRRYSGDVPDDYSDVAKCNHHPSDCNAGVACWAHRLAEARCGDYPAPCNCDDPITHTGRH